MTHDFPITTTLTRTISKLHDFISFLPLPAILCFIDHFIKISSACLIDEGVGKYH